MITISVLQTLLKALLYAGVVAGDELVDYSEYKGLISEILATCSSSPRVLVN